MRRLAQLIAFCGALLPLHSFSQKFSYRDLAGAWNTTDTLKPKYTLRFTDSVNLLIQGPEGSSYPATYTLGRLDNREVILIEMLSQGNKHYDAFALKVVNDTTIKCENLNEYNNTYQVKDNTNRRATARKKSASSDEAYGPTYGFFVITKRRED